MQREGRREIRPAFFSVQVAFLRGQDRVNLHRPATMMMPPNENKVLKESGNRQDEHELGELFRLMLPHQRNK
jgi:hypothetical protein